MYQLFPRGAIKHAMDRLRHGYARLERAPGIRQGRSTSGGQTRSYIQYIATSCKDDEPRPLLFDLHGGGFPATSTEMSSGYKAVVAAAQPPALHARAQHQLRLDEREVHRRSMCSSPR
jgi:hypothetical protein